MTPRHSDGWIISFQKFKDEQLPILTVLGSVTSLGHFGLSFTTVLIRAEPVLILPPAGQKQCVFNHKEASNTYIL